MTFEDAVKEYNDKIQDKISWKWTVGASARGMGHYSFGVITEHGELVVPDIEKEIAEAICEDHNKKEGLQELDNEYLKRFAEEKGVNLDIVNGVYFVEGVGDDFEFDTINKQECLNYIKYSTKGL